MRSPWTCATTSTCCCRATPDAPADEGEREQAVEDLDAAGRRVFAQVASTAGEARRLAEALRVCNSRAARGQAFRCCTAEDSASSPLSSAHDLRLVSSGCSRTISRSTSGRRTPSSTSRARASSATSRRWSRCRRTARGGRRVLAVGAEAKEMLGRTPGQHRRHPAAEGRRHRRLRDHRGDAALLHPEDPQPQDAGAAAHHHLRAVRHHRGGEARRARVGGVGGRARGLPGRGADGRGHRRRAARSPSRPAT